MPTTSAFERDIAQEPHALRALATKPLPEALARLDLDGYERIILTGMGASLVAAHPTWSSMVGEGRPTWWVSTAQLLAMPELVTQGSLLWVTSQSGESGEVVALLRSHEGKRRPSTLLATTNEPQSTLAQAADVVVGLHFGEEAAVSTKSYISTLAAHDRALSVLRHQDDARALERIGTVADELERFSPDVAPIVASGLASPRPRFAFVATPSDLATAQIAALLLNEVAKFPAEAFLTGEFRHGPIEMAGPGLVCLLFGPGTENASLTTLGTELARGGALVMTVDTDAGELGSQWPVLTRSSSHLGRLACGAKLVQLLSAEVARGLGIQPGHFLFGQKVTVAI
ncbi:MAG TPA: SIS domain-containing protein [Acidimicrobiales bacterium]|nr:SIS domain-containing protein [Acidimicrobiales bacterium]